MTMDIAPPTGAALLTAWASPPVADLFITPALAGYLTLLIRLHQNSQP